MAGFKAVLGVLSIVMLILGSIWILQGLKIPGVLESYMTGDIGWTYRGIGFDVAGLILLIFALRDGWRNIAGGFGALLGVLGAIWMLQGLNVLPGMSMSGHNEWIMRGGTAFVVGAVLTFVSSLGGRSAA